MISSTERALNILMGNGFDRKKSLKIIRLISASLLDSENGSITVNASDIAYMEELASDIDYIVWDIESSKDGNHKRLLIDLTNRLNKMGRVIKRYLSEVNDVLDP